MHPDLDPDQLYHALQGISIPPQPQIMVDLQMEQYTPEPNLDVVTKLIAQDPGLSSSFLKIVNSPFFGLPKRVSSTKRAVQLLGSQSSINLINALSIRSDMSDEIIIALNRFWDTAQDVAQTSLLLAKKLSILPPDDSYALGLFHECGIPLMLKRFPHYINILEEAYASAGTNCRVVDTENRLLRTNHAVVGYYAARSWNLPDHITKAIAYHHSATEVFKESSASMIPVKGLIAILKMSEHICYSCKVIGNQATDQEWNNISHLVLDYVGMSEYDFDNIKTAIRELDPI